MSALLDRLYHMHWVAPEVARSAQPYLGFYAAYLKPHHFKSIVNLRGENADYGWWQRETRVADALGIAHFDAKLSSRNLPSRAGLTGLFDALEKAKTPILLKCSGGQDRAGLAAALYILMREGPGALAKAQGQFAFWPYLHRPKRYQLWLKEFPAYALGDANGIPLAEWARTRYDAKRFAQWLQDKGLANAFRDYQAEIS